MTPALTVPVSKPFFDTVLNVKIYRARIQRKPLAFEVSVVGMRRDSQLAVTDDAIDCLWPPQEV